MSKDVFLKIVKTLSNHNDSFILKLDENGEEVYHLHKVHYSYSNIDLWLTRY